MPQRKGYKLISISSHVDSVKTQVIFRMKLSTSLSVLLAILPYTFAQSPVYGQCKFMKTIH